MINIGNAYLKIGCTLLFVRLNLIVSRKTSLEIDLPHSLQYIAVSRFSIPHFLQIFIIIIFTIQHNFHFSYRT